MRDEMGELVAELERRELAPELGLDAVDASESRLRRTRAQLAVAADQDDPPAEEPKVHRVRNGRRAARAER